MTPTELVLIYVFFTVFGLFLFAFILRWVLNTERIIKNQDAQLSALIELLKKQGATKDEIEGVNNMRR